MTQCRKVQPGVTTEEACWRSPIRDNNSRLVQLFRLAKCELSKHEVSLLAV